MIKYNDGAYGLKVLLRLHGSAVFKSLTPAVLSSVVYLICFHYTDLKAEADGGTPVFDHPYPMGALILAFSFLLTFKMSFSYNRYWEAVGSVHQMHSKWLDVGMEMAAFHMQSAIYNKPPSFGRHPEVTHLERERERLNRLSREELEERIEQMIDGDDNIEVSLRTRIKRRWKKTKPKLPKFKPDGQKQPPSRKTVKFSPDAAIIPTGSSSPREFQRVKSKRVLNGGLETEQASLFLQEGAHLLSLLSAVALSTLRNDLDQAESPLATFVPGAAWPCVDPDAYDADIRKDWAHTKYRTVTVLRYLFGRTRSAANRTLYNAARPFRVVGGVSDAEIQLLQAARGPLAKVALCSMWLQEFISREYMAGSTGGVSPPIISRLYQYTSDGMLGYNEARKVAYIPFPFPHAQMTSLFILVVVGLIPILMLTFVSNEIYGILLNILTVMCFTGLHEVARELENPFQNVPNDIPLNSFQAQYNEGLMTMYSGYHPDAFWEVEVLDYDVEKLKTGSQEEIPEEPMPIQSVASVEEKEAISGGSSGDKAAPS